MAKQPKDEKAIKTCFVIGPIGDEGSDTRSQADWFFHIVETGLHELDYVIKRADHMTTPGLITDQVINAVSDSDLVVADLTDHNPNVFYELAIRHREGKPVVHMISAGQKPPFDVAGFRLIAYSVGTPRLVIKAADQLREHALETEKKGYKVSNPITAARGAQKLEESGDSMKQLVLGLRRELRDVSNRLYVLEEESVVASPNAPEKLKWSGYEDTIRRLTALEAGLKRSLSDPKFGMPLREVGKFIIPPGAGSAIKGEPVEAQTKKGLHAAKGQHEPKKR